MTKVLAAIDAKPSAQPVLGTGRDADLFDATTVALHVREKGLAVPHELAGAAGVELREVSGTPVDQIVAAARDRDVAALVLDAGGARGGPQPAGHTALEVVTRLPKPVVVVPAHAQPPKQLARILVPLDGSSETSRALKATIELAHRRELEILVLHIHSAATLPAFADHEPHATWAWDQEFLTRHIATPHQHVSLLRRLGAPADDIASVARQAIADIVVLAWSQRLGQERAHVVSETLARSSIPVLLLPVLQRLRRNKRSSPTPYIAARGLSA